MNAGAAINIHFSPLLPDTWLIAAVAAVMILLTLSFLGKTKGILLRFLCAAAFIAALTGPSLIHEEREAVKDVAAIVIDTSPSQDIGARKETAEKTLAYLKEKMARIPGLEVRTVSAPSDGKIANETKLFDALDRALADVPKQRRAGVIFLTDGEVHDVPKNPELLAQYGPAHVLLTGHKNEKDRQMKITEAPAYGIAGQNVTLKYKIEDSGGGENMAEVTLDIYDGPPQSFMVPIGEEQTLELPLAHAGQNVFQLSVAAAPGELTQANNRAGLLVNGVRDRLRALLISGRPYAGARTWRDLLTSDPAVDLVHFTILREPEKIDSTPPQELALIAFPFDELFQVKLYEFDLIIFDRYSLNRILPQNYFSNIARYVEEGGALLVTGGPDFANEDSIYFTSLMDVLPGAPAGNVIERPFQPGLTGEGEKHPVTRALSWPAGKNGNPGWGPWLRQVSLNVQSGDVLMKGAEDKPLIILDRVKKGRVAQIASDQIWLWARGYEGGGPYAELMRRMVHWLMKEPELDENGLTVKTDKNEITIASRDYSQKEMTVTMTKPDGTREDIILAAADDGAPQKTIVADQLGVYAFDDGADHRQFALIGDINPPELAAVKTTPDLMKPLTQASGGGTIWLSETPQPGIRLLGKTNIYAGSGWIGLRANGDYAVKGASDKPLLPPWLAALILSGLAVFVWLREGKT